VFAFAVSMLASERYATYRNHPRDTGVLLCFLVASISSAHENWSTNAAPLDGNARHRDGVLHSTASCLSADSRTPGQEWQLVLAGAKQVQLNACGRAFSRLPPRRRYLHRDDLPR